MKSLLRLLDAAVGIVTLPATLAADVITLGGACVERDEPYTATQARQIMASIDAAARGGK